MATVGQLVVNLLGNTAHFKRAFGEVPGMLGGIMGRLTAIVGGAGGFGAVGMGVKLAADAEQMQVAFETMLGSAEKARSMLGELKQYAMKSPFTQIATTEAAQLLLNYGVAADEIMPTMRMLGDIAAGDEQKLHHLGLAFGQMSATGRLMGQDLNQMINAGFNPLQEISKRTGESMGALKARMEAGAIGIDEVRQALIDATSEGGRFFGMTDKQAGTLAGRFSTMKDEINESLRSIGQQLIDTFNIGGWIETANIELGRFREFIQQSGHDLIILGGAVVGFVSGLVAVRTALQAASAAQAIWLAMSGPAGMATVLLGLATATLAVQGLEEMFNASAQRALALSQNTAKAAQSVRDLANAGKQMTGGDGGIGKAIERLRAIREEMHRASGNNLLRLQGEEKEQLGKIDRMGSFKNDVDQSMEMINKLHKQIDEARRGVDQLGQAKVNELTYEWERQIGVLSGYTDKVQALREEIMGMSQIEKDARELSHKGATHEQVDEFRALSQEAEKLKELRTARDQLMTQVESPTEGFKKQLDQLQELRERGMIDLETFNRGRDLAAKEFAKKEDAAIDKSDRPSNQPLEALLRDSKASADAIARGMMGGKDKNPNAKLESLAERQAKAAERAEKYLEEIAGKPPEKREEVDL